MIPRVSRLSIRLAAIASPRRVLACRRLLRRHALLIGACVFVVALAFRVAHLDARSIWLDEDAQARTAASGVGLDMARRAATQAQPPLDYLLEGVGLRVFGWNEYGARMHAALLGAGAAALFFGLLMTAVRHPAAVLLGTAAFVTHPELIRYSQEGRPISCGVFFSVLWLWAVFRFLRARPTRARAWAPAAASVLVSGVLFLLSVGLQPVVFLIVSGVALAPALALSRLRARILAIWALTAVAGVVALPALALILRAGAPYVASPAVQDPLAVVLKSAAGFRLADWLARLAVLMGSLSALALVAVPLGVSGLLLSRRRRTEQEAAVLGFFGVFALAYPVVFHGLYFGFVSPHELAVRYYLTALPPLLLLLALLFASGLRIAGNGGARRSNAWRLAAAALLAAATVAASIQATAALGAGYRAGERTGWRSLYSVLKRDTRRHGTAYLMNLVPFGKWAPERFCATSFYYSPEDQQRVVLRSIDALRRDLVRGRITTDSDVYLVVHYGSAALAALTVDELPGVTSQRFAELVVVRVAAGGDVEADLRRVLGKMAAAVSEDAGNYKVFEMQAVLGLLAKDSVAARRAIDKLSRIDRDGRLREAIIPGLERELAMMGGA
jgi:hypothetical protein